MATNRIEHYAEVWDSDREHVLGLLKDWRPRSFNLSEKEQEQELLAWLQQAMPTVPIVSQYGIAKGKADIVIQDQHVIELKLGFTEDSVGEFDRCIGQLERYRQKWVEPDRGPVYLVVVGRSDIEFSDMLHKCIRRLDASYAGTWFHLVEKC